MEIKTINDLADVLHLLPGIGTRSAERMAYQLLDMPSSQIDRLINALQNLKDKVSICPICGAYQEDNKCPFCSMDSRDKNTLVVVTSYKDALAFEKLGVFHGLYHILGGNISPSKGIGIENVRIDSLLKRLEDSSVEEIILATDPTIDGETTALYIAKLLEDQNIKVTRLAYGLPMGSQLTYADTLTLLRSFEGRKKVN